MIEVLLASSDMGSTEEMERAMVKTGVRVVRAGSCDEALSKLENGSFDIVVADENLSDGDGLGCVKKLIMTNPMVNCAAISALSEEDFHEASEGLGVLMRLPPSPGGQDAKRLLDRLKSVLNLERGAF